MAQFALHVNGAVRSIEADGNMPVAMGIARSARADGHEVWLRHWDVRSLYDPPGRQPGALVSDIAG